MKKTRECNIKLVIDSKKIQSVFEKQIKNYPNKNRLS
jgi:hypothetical protein